MPFGGSKAPEVKRYAYVSSRLADEVLLASPGKSIPKVSKVTPPVVGGSIAVDWSTTSVEQMAAQIRKATKAANPSRSLEETSRYFLTTLQLKWAELRVLDPPVEVAWLSGFDDADSPTTFVSLCGSLANFRDWQPSENPSAGGWFPSSVFGMGNVLRAWQDDDPQSARRAVDTDDQKHWVHSASVIHSTLGEGRWIGSGEARVLFECYFRTTDLDTARLPESVNLALFGAPVWVGLT
jgi:hypothetical protein